MVSKLLVASMSIWTYLWRKRSDSSDIPSVRGSVMVESALVMPVIVLFLVFVLDIGRLIDNYLVMSQIVREGVRLASATPTLEPSQSSDPTLVDLSAARTATDVQTAQYQVRGRVYKLLNLEAQTFGKLSLKNVTINSSYNDDSALQPEMKRTVTIKVTGTYKPLFAMFPPLPLSVSISGPYLYSS